MKRRPVVTGKGGRTWPEWWPLAVAVFFLLAFLFFLSAIPHQPSPSSLRSTASILGEKEELQVGWDADLRVAWVVPFISAPSMPPYTAFCLRTIAASSPFVHVYVFYENATMVLPDVQADNIHYVSIAEQEVATRLLKVMKGGLSEYMTERAERSVKLMLQTTPRRVGVYKPLFGSAFQDFIGSYSHWAWGDIDTLIGDVAGKVSGDDLRNFDVISFNTGSGLLYLQGQLTILANRPDVNDAWMKAPGADSLATSNPAFAWEETKFTDWALHTSTLRVKLMPLQFSGKYGKKWPKDNPPVLIWDNGRLLLHSPSQPSGSPLPEQRVEAPLLPQDTWTSHPQRPGPWVLERQGSDQKCVWYGSRRAARGYDLRTEEYLVFHYNYLHEEKIPSELGTKRPEEVQVLLRADRLTWQYLPFDFKEAPPCGLPGGGHCPSREDEIPGGNVL